MCTYSGGFEKVTVMTWSSLSAGSRITACLTTDGCASHSSVTGLSGGSMSMIIAAAAPKESFRLYDSTYLLYTDGWNEIDRLSAYLVNAKMRDMCKKEDSTSLIFDAVSEDLVSMFNDTFFVVGMTHVQSQETITVSTSGHRATDTERHGTGGRFAQSATELSV